jgi:hypothetical protein
MNIRRRNRHREEKTRRKEERDRTGEWKAARKRAGDGNRIRIEEISTFSLILLCKSL